MHQLFSSNAYKILGLPSSATHNEVESTLQSLIKSVKLGVRKPTLWDFLSSDPLPCQESDILHARSRLSNKTDRLRERFYWFYCRKDLRQLLHKDMNALSHLIDFYHSNNNAEEFHDTVILRLMLLIQSDSDYCELEQWSTLITYWSDLTCEQYWEKFIRMELESCFRPAALHEDFTIVRNKIDEALPRFLLDSAISSFQQLDDEKFKNLIKIHENLPYISDFHSELPSICEEDLETNCQAILERIQHVFRDHEDLSLENISEICRNAWLDYQKEISPRINLMVDYLSVLDIQKQRYKEHGANLLGIISKAVTWSNDFAMAAYISDKALKLIDESSTLYSDLFEDNQRFLSYAQLQLSKQKKQQDDVTATTTRPHKLTPPKRSRLSTIVYSLTFISVIVYGMFLAFGGPKEQEINASLSAESASESPYANDSTDSQTPTTDSFLSITTQEDPTFIPVRNDGHSEITADNSSGSTHIFGKLYYLDGSVPLEVRRFSIQKGDSLLLHDVSPGTYEFRFQAVGTKNTFKTENFVITEEETAEGIKYTQYSITLYTVTNGNTSMQSISASDF